MDATFYKNRCNDVEMSIFNNGAAVNMASFTKVEMVYDGGAVNSVDNAALFDIQSSSVILKFGDLDVPKGLYNMTLVMYTADCTDGIVWQEDISIRIDEK